MRELDAKVAEKVFGYHGIGYYGPPAEGDWMHEKSRWFATAEEAVTAMRERYPGREDLDAIDLCYWKDGWGPLFVYEYTSCPSSDYGVLKHVREKWDDEKHGAFCHWLLKLWEARNQKAEAFIGRVSMRYEPGDYSKAALMVLDKE